jgi:hypothetical protein
LGTIEHDVSAHYRSRCAETWVLSNTMYPRTIDHDVLKLGYYRTRCIRALSIMTVNYPPNCSLLPMSEPSPNKLEKAIAYLVQEQSNIKDALEATVDRVTVIEGEYLSKVNIYIYTHYFFKKATSKYKLSLWRQVKEMNGKKEPEDPSFVFIVRNSPGLEVDNSGFWKITTMNEASSAERSQISKFLQGKLETPSEETTLKKVSLVHST